MGFHAQCGNVCSVEKRIAGMKKYLLIFLMITVLLVTVILVFTLPASAATYTGTCGANGDNLTWTLDTETGVLTISGTGEMKNYGSSSDVPWDSYRSKIKTVEMSDGVTRIGEGAFLECGRLTSIEIPDSVTSIGESAFEDCSSLTSMEIPDSVTSIGDKAFAYCPGIETMTVSSNNTVYRSSGNCIIETATKTLLAGCKNSVIPTDGSVTSIGECAFYRCSSLTSIEIPDGVTSIGRQAFYICRNLETITFRSSTTTIYDSSYTIDSGATIYGYPGSTAEAYATKYSRTFVALHDPNTPCTFDQERVAAKYLKSAATCTEQAVYYKSCLCGMASPTDTFTSGALLDHVYDNAADPDCNLCGSVKYTPGDVDGNEGISSDDAVYLLMNTFFPEAYPVNQPCDYDGNGQVSSDDAVYLLMHTFFPDDYPLTQQVVAAIPAVMATAPVGPKRDGEE